MAVSIPAIKYLLFFFNLIFAVSGIAIMIVGIMLFSIFTNFTSFVNSNFTFFPTAVTVIGLVAFIIAFFGCCGSLKENLCMVSTFVSLLITVLIVQLVALIGIFMFENDLKGFMVEKMNSSLSYYLYDDAVFNAWDYVQRKYQCCGVKDKYDWQGNIPSSCCDIAEGKLCPEDLSYSDGCWDKILQHFKTNLHIFAVIAFITALVELCGIGLSCCLAHFLHKE